MNVIHSPIHSAFQPRTDGKRHPIKDMFRFGDSVGGTWLPMSPTALGQQVMFQDSAGATPVTAVEQSVGLWLDASRGLVRGDDAITNAADRDFSSDTGYWTKGTAWVISGGQASRPVDASSSNLTNNTALVSGVTYEVSINIVALSGTLTVFAGGAAFKAFTTAGVKTCVLTASGTQVYLQAAAGTSVTIDDVSYRRLPGNHYTNATSTKRPTWTKRYNRLTNTEDFTNAAWTKVNTSAPSATLVVESAAGSAVRSVAVYAISVTSGIGYTLFVRAAPAGLSHVNVRVNDNASNANAASVLVNVATGAVTGAATAYGSFSGASATVTASSAVAGAYDIALTFVPSVASFAVKVELSSGAARSADGQAVAYTGTGSDGLYVYGVDLRLSSHAGLNIPAYQWVTTGAAGGYDESGFPGRLQGDGVDDFLQSAANVDLSATDAVTWVAAVSKISDAAAAVVAEHTASAEANAGYAIKAPDGASATIAGYSRGTLTATGSAGSLASPSIGVLSLQAKISTDALTLRRNGSSVATSASDQGTGNYASAVGYLFSRAGTGSFFSGSLMSDIVAPGRTLTSTELDRAERYAAAQAGVPAW